jgi:tricorn protease
VWAHGGDLWRLRPGEEPQRIEVEVRSQRTERQRRFTSAASALEDVDLHPDGHSVALTVRGQVVTMGHWEGPADVLPAGPGRLRLARWVAADRLLVVSDGGGDEVLEVHRLDGSEVRRYEGLDHGRILAAQVDPTGTRVALTDQRHGLYLLDLGTGGWTEVDRPPAGEVGSLDWSADGRYLAWARPEGVGGPRSRLRLLDVTTGERADLTSGDHLDFAPSFDPAGHLLYFLSGRDFDPVDETHGFGYAFVRGTRPYAIPLRSDVRDPFRPDPRPLEPHKSTGPRGADALHRAVELAGLTDRLVPFPIAEGRYTQLVGLTGHVLLVRAPIRGTLDRSWYRPGPPRADSSLLVWDFDKQELTELNPRISSARVDRRREHLAIASGGRLRVVSAKLDKGQRDELKKTEGRADRKSGWIDLGRARVSVDPGAEWSQMVREAWRLMRDGFWEPGMAGVDWDAILRRYLALVERIATRGELSDLIWCMQGELATSHAYEMGGDYVEPPSYRVGRLGADLVWDPERQGWRISRILRGDPGDRERTSPLAAPGLGLAEGDVVVEIAGARAAGDLPPEAALVHRAGTQVSLGVRTGTGARRVVVDALSDDRPLRYRDWVLANRRRVHEDSGGRIGYVHVPDMGPPGFAEFARDFGRECERDALLVDVRWNRGGHVSQLLLARLTQRRLGWRISRWGAPVPYPYQSVAGPMLALTNEMAGSDGDIFSHAWRRLGLGPLMGTRTWGGVVGISPDHLLVDRGVTTQPEYATWFEDVGYGLENHGAEPDLVVEVGPDDWARGADPQLEAAVSWLARELAAHPPRPAAPGR